MGSNGPIGAGNVLKKRNLAKKIALVGTTIPSQAKAHIMAGVIREGFLWSPKEAGLAMTSVARLALDGAKFESGMTVPGLGRELPSVQPMASSLEQSLFLLVDIVAMMLIERKGVSMTQMQASHTNLEGLPQGFA